MGIDGLVCEDLLRCKKTTVAMIGTLFLPWEGTVRYGSWWLAIVISFSNHASFLSPSSTTRDELFGRFISRRILKVFG